jgi:predicted  nucleic acid-binding Zn-ribbon protein
VESAQEDLVLLVQLQRTYDLIAGAIRERQTPPPEVQELQEQNRRRQTELDALEAQVAQHTDDLRDVRKQEEEWKLELEHFQKQKGMVTNEREFTAVISEIDYASRALAEASNRRQELEQAIQQLTDEIAARRNARPEEEAAHREVVDEWERRKDELRVRVHDLAEQAQAIESKLSPKHRARFLRLLESKKGTALAAVVDASCSVCHFSVRPHLQQRVRRCQELIVCEHCQRILFFEDIVRERGAEVGAG